MMLLLGSNIIANSQIDCGRNSLLGRQCENWLALEDGRIPNSYTDLFILA